MDENGSRNGQQYEEEIVIAGGGVGGLACALALHKVGIKAVVLEQSDTLRAGGSALALWNNAFSVLDVLGIGEQFRSMFTNLAALEILSARGKSLGKVEIADCDGGPHNFRAVERKVLLEVLAGELPEGTIRFKSRVIDIKKPESRPGIFEVELHDGSTYTAKVVIGFDGISSCVASWIGLQKAQPVGLVGIQGIAVLPEGHTYEDKAQIFLGQGYRTAYFPTSHTKVSWNIVWTASSQGWRNTTEEQMKDEALLLVSKLFPSTPLSFIITNSLPEGFSKITIRHRVNPNPDSLVDGGVTVAGDAAHPTTPNMGQGGCMALEDALILTQKLYGALRSTPNTEDQETSTVVPEHERIHQALLAFQRERHERTNFITTQSYKIGRILHTGCKLIDIVRDWLVVPRLLNKDIFMAHTLFDVGKLPGQEP